MAKESYLRLFSNFQGCFSFLRFLSSRSGKSSKSLQVRSGQDVSSQRCQRNCAFNTQGATCPEIRFALVVLEDMSGNGNVSPNSCQPCFSDVYLFEAFQEREFNTKCWLAIFLSHFTGQYLVFEVFQTRGPHFCFCLVRIKMPWLICNLARYSGHPIQRNKSNVLTRKMLEREELLCPLISSL